MTVSTADVTKALPPNLRSAVTDSLVDRLNNITSDPIVADHIKHNFISYTTVLQEGKFKLDDYLSAVGYVSYKLMGLPNSEAYKRTFPSRYQQLKARGASEKDISSYVAAYNRGKLVNLILEQTLVPTWVLNQDVYQKAINVQAELMTTAHSEMVRTTAANSILTQLQKPKEAGPLINVDMRENSGMNELQDMLTKLAKQQKDLIEGGVDTKSVAEQELVLKEEEHVPD